MQPKTQTTLAALKEGDRFYFSSDSKRVAHQVTEIIGDSKAYNIIHQNGNRHWQYDKVCRSDRMVVFLRSTLIFMLCLTTFCSQAQWYKPTKNDIAIAAVQLLAGGADGLREEVLYHPNNLLRQHPNLNRQYWDSRISWHNKENHWVPFSDANHTLRTTIQSLDLLSIGIALGEKNRNWKAALRKMIIGYLARKAGFTLIYNLHFKNN